MKEPVSLMLANCDPNGPLGPLLQSSSHRTHGWSHRAHFSGTLSRGQKVYLVRDKREIRFNKFRFLWGRVASSPGIPAGNIAAITGLSNLRAGETIVARRSRMGSCPLKM